MWAYKEIKSFVFSSGYSVSKTGTCILSGKIERWDQSTFTGDSISIVHPEYQIRTGSGWVEERLGKKNCAHAILRLRKL